MLSRLLATLVVSTLLLWGAGPLPLWGAVVVVASVGWLVFQGPRLWLTLEEPTSTDGKVVSLDAFRKRKERERKAQDESTGLREVFASPVLHEADLTASLLEHHGIAVHVFNRHNASMLPMGEMPVRVMVSQVDWPRAQRLLENQPSGFPPEDSSTA